MSMSFGDQAATTRADPIAAVMVVDDDRLSRFAITGAVEDLGYTVTACDGGARALEMLLGAGGGAFDVVLLDRVMPAPDGVDVARRMKQDARLRDVPIIMITGSDSPDEMREALELGIFYYLTKPVEQATLASLLASAARQRQELRRLRGGGDDTGGFDVMQAGRFQVRTLRDAAAVAGFVANLFPNPERSVQGIWGLLSNAVEHGLCGIGFERKGQMLRTGDYAAQVDRLCALQDDGRHVEASVLRRPADLVLSIRDPGAGFDWRMFIDANVTGSSASHGRGIALARTIAFDQLRYDETGNHVVASVRREEQLIW